MGFPVLVEERIIERNKVTDFDEALSILSAPLVQEGYIDVAYVDAISKSLKVNGPYFVLAPYIALPHAQTNGFVHNLALSVLRVKKEVSVGGQPVNLFVMLASEDVDQHLGILSKMVEIMDTLEKQEELLTCDFATLTEKMMSLI